MAVRERTLDKVKLALRVATDALDADLEGNIIACLHDLQASGVSDPFEEEPLVLRAIILYAKANFGFSADAEYFQRAYDAQKNALRLDVTRHV